MNLELFKALSCRKRFKIMQLLSIMPELSVGQLVDATNIEQSLLSHNLRVLRKAKLVLFRRDGQNVLYSIKSKSVWLRVERLLTSYSE